MGNKSSRIAGKDGSVVNPTSSSSSSTSADAPPAAFNSSSTSPSSQTTALQNHDDDDEDKLELLLAQRRRSNLERRSTIPMELEDPDDFTVGESAAEYLYADDQSIATRKQQDVNDEDKDILSSLREQLLQFPKEFRNILAGGTAGIIAKSVVAPMDRIKILYQVSSAQFHILDIPRAVRHIIQDEGFSALWKGNMATMIRIFPYSGIQFMVFDRIRHFFLHEQHETAGVGAAAKQLAPAHHQQQQQQQRNVTKWGLTPIESLVAGMIAGTISVICTYPLDLTRAQLAVLKKQKQHYLNQSFWSVLTDNYKCRGIPGLFRGIAPTLLGILPYSGVAFALNEQGKREIQHLTGREVTTMERIQCGALAGLVAQTLTYPIEVTRRRMQTIGIVGIHGTDSAVGALGCSTPTTTATIQPNAAASRPPGLMRTVQDLYAEQGVRGFMKGVSMNWMKGPVAFGISFTTFDHIQKWMESAKEREARLPPSVVNSKASSSSSS